MDQNLSYTKPLDIFGRSPLTTAVAWGHLNVSKLLIDNKEDEKIINDCNNPCCRPVSGAALQSIELKPSLGHFLRSRRYRSTFLHLCKLFFHLSIEEQMLIEDRWPYQSIVIFLMFLPFYGFYLFFQSLYLLCKYFLGLF